jgi:serine protease AprX
MIHTSSWGTKPEGEGERAKYAEAAEAIDSYAWTDKRLVILFAAGNGSFVSTISYQAHAKNCITVGACQSKQPGVKIPDEEEPGGFRLNMQNDPEEVADFSSKGPTSDGRIKPDVVAPGVFVLSTRTSAMYPGRYSNRDGISEDETWMYCSGTSMATPLVAGCCAVIRGALEDNGTSSRQSPAHQWRRPTEGASSQQRLGLRSR